MNYLTAFSEAAKRMKSSKIREILKLASKPGLIHFSVGNPDDNYLPYQEIQKILSEFSQKKWKSSLQYCATQGIPELVNILKKRMNEKLKINLTNQELFVTSGGMQGLYLTAKALLNPGDICLIESPTFIGFIQSALVNQCKLEAIPLESDGINVDELEKTIIKYLKIGKKPKLLYTITNFQNPGGTTTSKEKKKKIYEIAKKYNVIVLEDDPYGCLYYEGEEEDYYPIKSLGNNAPVIYFSSFSKILSPGFRVGWAIGDKELIEKCALLKQGVDSCSSTYTQTIAAEYLKHKFDEKYISQMKIIYKEKRDLMLQLCDEHFPSDVTAFSRPKGGFFLYYNLPEGMSSNKLFMKCIENKVSFITGDAFHLDQTGDTKFRLAFSSCSKEDIQKGIPILGRCLKELQQN